MFQTSADIHSPSQHASEKLLVISKVPVLSIILSLCSPVIIQACVVVYVLVVHCRVLTAQEAGVHDADQGLLILVAGCHILF